MDRHGWRYTGRLLNHHQPRVGSNIRTARRVLGLSAYDLAERIGCDAATASVVRMVELGTRPLTLPMLVRIADALDMTPGQLWRGDFRCLVARDCAQPAAGGLCPDVARMLTTREREIVGLMARRPGRFFTAGQLGHVMQLSDAQIRTLIWRVRGKAAAIRIENRQAMGYRLVAP